MKMIKNELNFVVFFALLNLLLLVPAVTWAVNYPDSIRTILLIVICVSNIVSIVCVVLAINRRVKNKRK